MTQNINIGGKSRPVLFGMGALYRYEVRTGRKALSDFAELSSGEVSIKTMVDLIFSGLEAGAAKERQPIDFEEADVAEWLTDSPGVMQEMMEAFAASFPQASGDDAKKKATMIPTKSRPGKS